MVIMCAYVRVHVCMWVCLYRLVGGATGLVSIVAVAALRTTHTAEPTTAAHAQAKTEDRLPPTSSTSRMGKRLPYTRSLLGLFASSSLVQCVVCGLLVVWWCGTWSCWWVAWACCQAWGGQHTHHYDAHSYQTGAPDNRSDTSCLVATEPHTPRREVRPSKNPLRGLSWGWYHKGVRCVNYEASCGRRVVGLAYRRIRTLA
jgi:hypothetical protein